MRQLHQPKIKADHIWRLGKIRDAMRSELDAAEIQWALGRIEMLEKEVESLKRTIRNDNDSRPG